MSRLDELYRQRARLAALIEREEEAQVAAGPINSGRIVRTAANLYGVTAEEVMSLSRDRQVVKARHAACWMLRARGVSLPRIGAIIGRDHTTALYACRKIDADPAVRALLWPLLGRAA